MEEYLEKYRVWLVLKNYAKRTQKCYLSAFKNYWIWCEKQQKNNPKFKQKDAVQTYLVYRFEVDKVAWQTINGDYSGIRLFYVNILGREWDEDKLPRPRKEKIMPAKIAVICTPLMPLVAIEIVRFVLRSKKKFGSKNARRICCLCLIIMSFLHCHTNSIFCAPITQDRCII